MSLLVCKAKWISITHLCFREYSSVFMVPPVVLGHVWGLGTNYILAIRPSICIRKIGSYPVCHLQASSMGVTTTRLLPNADLATQERPKQKV